MVSVMELGVTPEPPISCFESLAGSEFIWSQGRSLNTEHVFKIGSVKPTKRGITIHRPGEEPLRYERADRRPRRVSVISDGSIAIKWFQGHSLQQGWFEIGRFNGTQWVSEYENRDSLGGYPRIVSFSSTVPQFCFVFGENHEQSGCIVYRKGRDGWQGAKRFDAPRLKDSSCYHRLSMCEWQGKNYLLALVARESSKSRQPDYPIYEQELSIHDTSPGQTTSFKSIILPDARKIDDIYCIPVEDSLVLTWQKSMTLIVTRQA